MKLFKVLLVVPLILLLFQGLNLRTYAASSSILISEVLYDPTGTDLGYEWIEFKNISSAPVTLDGWQIQVAGNVFTTVFTFPAGTTIAPVSFLTVGENQTTANIKISLLGFQNGGTSTDGVRLVNSTLQPIDTVLYDDNNTANLLSDTGQVATSFAIDLDSGLTLCRSTDTDTDNSATDFMACLELTPGAKNSIPQKPVATITAPTQVFTDQTLKLYGSESTSENGDIVDWEWQIQGQEYSESAPSHKFTGINPVEVKLVVTDEIGMVAETTKQITVKSFNKSEYAGLQITEVFPAPKETDPNKDGASDDKDEYIEISNTSNRDINLSGLQLADESTKDLPEFTFQEINLKPNQSLAVFKETSDLTLNNTKETIYLLGPGGETISIIAYTKTEADQSWHQLLGAIFDGSPSLGQIPTTLAKTGESLIDTLKEFRMSIKYDMLSIFKLLNHKDPWLLKVLRKLRNELQKHPQLENQLRDQALQLTKQNLL